MSKKTEREMHLFRLGPAHAVNLRIKIDKKFSDRWRQKGVWGSFDQDSAVIDRRYSRYPCLRWKRATSRAVSRSTARFFKSARLSRATLPWPTPSSALSFPFFQYSLRTTSARPLT